MNLCACDLCFGFVPPFPLATFFALLSLHLFHHIQEQVTFSHLRIHPSKCILLMVMWLRVNCRLWVLPSPKSPSPLIHQQLLFSFTHSRLPQGHHFTHRIWSEVTGNLLGSGTLPQPNMPQSSANSKERAPGFAAPGFCGLPQFRENGVYPWPTPLLA